jgi:uncharacterized protein
MIFRLILTSCLLLPTWAYSACGPGDLRASLSQEQRSELEDRIGGQPYASGNHWRATRGDQTIHVIGTLHLPNSRMVAIVERLRPIIEHADLLMTEITKDGKAALEKEVAAKPELAFLTEGPTLIDLLEPEVWQRVSAAARDRGIPGFLAAKFQPWYLSMMLSMPPCAMQEVQRGALGLDFLLMQVATNAGVPVRPLEPFGTALKILGTYPLDQQIEFLSLQVFDDAFAELASATLVTQYFEQEHLPAVELSRITAREAVSLDRDKFDKLFDELMDTLLVQRNLDWMDRIRTIDAQTFVVAAGAGHLGGQQGLLYLLEMDGYALERLPF